MALSRDMVGLFTLKATVINARRNEIAKCEILMFPFSIFHAHMTSFMFIIAAVSFVFDYA